MQAAQLAWRLVTQLLSDDDKLMVSRALGAIPHDVIMGIVESSGRIPDRAALLPPGPGLVRCAICTTRSFVLQLFVWLHSLI